MGFDRSDRLEDQGVSLDGNEGVELQAVVRMYGERQTERAPAGGHLPAVGHDVVAEEDIASDEESGIVDVVGDLGEVNGCACGEGGLQQGMLGFSSVVAVVGCDTVHGRVDGRVAHVDLSGVGTGTEGVAFAVGDQDVAERDGIDSLGQVVAIGEVEPGDADGTMGIEGVEAVAADGQVDGAVGQDGGCGSEFGGRKHGRQLPEPRGGQGSGQFDVERDVGHLGDIGEGEGDVGIRLEGEGQERERVLTVGDILHEGVTVDLCAAGAVAGELVGLGDGGARHAIDAATSIGIAAHGLDGLVGVVGKRVGPGKIGSGDDHMLVQVVLELEGCVEFTYSGILVAPDDLVAMGGEDGRDGGTLGQVGADAVFGGIAELVGEIYAGEVDVARRGVVELYPVGLLLVVVDVDAVVGRDLVDDHGREL